MYLNVCQVNNDISCAYVFWHSTKAAINNFGKLAGLNGKNMPITVEVGL
jgi:hypothetical protein